MSSLLLQEQAFPLMTTLISFKIHKLMSCATAKIQHPQPEFSNKSLSMNDDDQIEDIFTE